MAQFQINQANFAYDNFSLGIYCIRSAAGDGPSNSSFPNKPMMIYQDTNTINGSYMSDLDFSFIVKNGSSFELGLFLYNPKYIKMNNVRNTYKKDGILPNNCDYFHNIGVYIIHFDVNNMNEDNIKRNHFNLQQTSDNNRNQLNFDFYFMKLDEDKHSNILRGKTNIYYISNPSVSFNPNYIQ